ncbi:MAG: ImmA/IrrE family metallo-endopeptidase [Oligoflexales bacterium]|nr:ImmA/IrrE family metallo-endopeptidase [Oligoflexales bacterium]
MRKTDENRYPHSATLFKFCKEALGLRYGGNVKVIDQDVGAILGYDPADCSHWKKGKKNIRALSTLKNIAEHLHIDERLLIDITAGKMSLEEALFEYKGYGHFSLQDLPLENFKKEYFKNPARWQPSSQSKTFEELFDVRREEVVALALSVLKRGDFQEAPIYLPELCQLIPQVSLEEDELLGEALEIQSHRETHSELVIRYNPSKMRPYMRFLIAKQLFKHMQYSSIEKSGLWQNPDEILEIQSNIFASILLIPGHLLQQEVGKVDSSFDIVQQLADIFWVSKALMNKRLTDYLTLGL